MKIFSIAALGALTISFAACNNADKSTMEARKVFFDRSGMDTTTKPGDNFFLYANGTWLKTTQIPDDQSGWGSFYTLYDENQKNLRGILEDAEKGNNSKGSIEQKVGDYYASGMDTVAIEKVGAEPLKPMLAKIDVIKDYKQLADLLIEDNANGEP